MKLTVTYIRKSIIHFMLIESFLNLQNYINTQVSDSTFVWHISFNLVFVSLYDLWLVFLPLFEVERVETQKIRERREHMEPQSVGCVDF